MAAGAASARVVELRDGEDTAPYSFLPSLARGGHPTLYAYHLAADGGEHSFETYLRFELPPDLLGPDEEIGMALLYVDYALEEASFGEGSDEPGMLECRPVTSPWTEMGVTWASRPSYGEPVDVVEGIQALGPLSCDVTELVQAWVDGAPNYGIALTNPTARILGFYSFDAPAEIPPAQLPALFIEVVPAPEPAAGAGALAAIAALWAVRARRRMEWRP